MICWTLAHIEHMYSKRYLSIVSLYIAHTNIKHVSWNVVIADRTENPNTFNVKSRNKFRWCAFVLRARLSLDCYDGERCK